MPQWYRDRERDSAKYPDERWQSHCPAAAVDLLLRYDHHTVCVNQRIALIRTYHWIAEDAVEPDTPRRFEISFTYATGHPAAPPAVQAVIDGLTFSPVERANER